LYFLAPNIGHSRITASRDALALDPAAYAHDFVSFAGLREEPIDIRTIMRHYKLTPKQVTPQ